MGSFEADLIHLVFDNSSAVGLYFHVDRDESLTVSGFVKYAWRGIAKKRNRVTHVGWIDHETVCQKLPHCRTSSSFPIPTSLCQTVR